MIPIRNEDTYRDQIDNEAKQPHSRVTLAAYRSHNRETDTTYWRQGDEEQSQNEAQWEGRHPP